MFINRQLNKEYKQDRKIKLIKLKLLKSKCEESKQKVTENKTALKVNI